MLNIKKLPALRIHLISDSHRSPNLQSLIDALKESIPYP
jgi:hypothetical protein